MKYVLEGPSGRLSKSKTFSFAEMDRDNLHVHVENEFFVSHEYMRICSDFIFSI